MWLTAASVRLGITDSGPSREDCLPKIKQWTISRRPAGRLRKRRALIVLAAIVLVLLFSSSLSRSRRVPIDTTSRHTSLDNTSGPLYDCACLELLEERHRADFWTVEATSAPTPRVVVRPAAPYVDCPALSNAIFSLWIDYPDETQFVSTPPRQGPIGVYTFSSFPPPLVRRAGEESLRATLRPRLEFAFYPGGEAGQPCNARECLPEHLEHTGVRFSGEELLTPMGDKPAVTLALPPATASQDYCTELDSLASSYSASSGMFTFGDAQSIPCRLHRVGEPLPHRTKVRWIHLQGDSNTRYLAFELARMLGLTETATHVEREHSNLPTTAISHDGSGTGIVVVFRWVFLEHWDSDVDFLSRVQLTSLRAFLESIPYPRSTTWPAKFLDPGLRPTDLFISFGSHAQRLSRTGFQAAVDRLRPGLARCSRLSRSTYFLLTSAAEPLDIPARYAGDELMRNNRIIDMQNSVGRDLFRKHFPQASIVDFFTVTRTIPRSLQLDSVHFLPEVYRIQADLIWTAIMAADERHLSL